MTVNQRYALAEQYWSEPWKESQVVGEGCPRNQYRKRYMIHLETWDQPADANTRGWVRMSDDDDLVIVKHFKNYTGGLLTLCPRCNKFNDNI